VKRRPAMEESERKKIAVDTIAADLERLKNQADANELSLLAYLIEMALAEARETSN
jgi:hypothetical protein